MKLLSLVQTSHNLHKHMPSLCAPPEYFGTANILSYIKLLSRLNEIFVIFIETWKKWRDNWDLVQLGTKAFKWKINTEKASNGFKFFYF
jgi:hypothetical protein